MLDTVLEIGKVLRGSPNGLKHHRFIKPAPVPDEKRNPIRFWSVPVKDDGSFDFSEISPLNDENKQKRLFYLNYKDAENDNKKKYVFGDIYHVYDINKKTGKEAGNFFIGADNDSSDIYKQNSLKRANTNTPMTQASERIICFRQAFSRQWSAIRNFMLENNRIYIHFDFDGKGWHELDDMVKIESCLFDLYFRRVATGVVVRTSLYKTLAASKYRLQNFSEDNNHKNLTLKTEEEALDLLYGLNSSERPSLRLRDMSLIVLPRGEGLTAKQIERFFDRSSMNNSKVDAEAEVQDEVEKQDQQIVTDGIDALFAMLVDDPQTRNIAQFDFVFSIAGGTKADIDLIELAGLERSKLAQIRDNIKEVRQNVEKEREAFFLRLYGKPPKKPLDPLSITGSFLNILSNKTSKEKKYQSHLYKVLPQIYTGTYYHDLILLSALIERTEANIRSDRSDVPNFNLLKFNFYFLMRVQNNKGERLVEIQNSPSYRIGLLLGRLARGLRTKINSFDKNYAGLLSRRIGTLNDVMSLQNEFNQKLIMHDRAGWSFKFSDELTGEIKTFTGTYNKDECAFGFFESYFAPRKVEEDQDDNVAQVQA